MVREKFKMQNLKFFDLSKIKSYKLIDGVVIHPLRVNCDPRGILVEIMKTSWKKIYDKKKLPFSQTYYSITDSNVARDEDLWHYHPGGQQDRFGVIKGEIVVAIFDNRQGSPSFGKLNLFHLGELPEDRGQYLVLVPAHCLHGFLVVSQESAILFNFPTKLHDPQEEERIAFEKVKIEDGTVFSWNIVRKEFKLPFKK